MRDRTLQKGKQDRVRHGSEGTENRVTPKTERRNERWQRSQSVQKSETIEKQTHTCSGFVNSSESAR